MKKKWTMKRKLGYTGVDNDDPVEVPGVGNALGLCGKVTNSAAFTARTTP